MSWMPRPFRTKTAKVPFSQFRFADPGLDHSIDAYARFLFARITFVKGTLCANHKKGRFHEKGEMNLLHVRKHADRDGILGVSLVQKSTGLTKSVCVSLPQDSILEGLGQGCRLASSLVQDGIGGLVELCPNNRVRVWALFNEPLPAREAVEKVKSLKKRSFISNEGTYFPDPDGQTSFLELPPYPDSDSGQWSLLMPLDQAESLLDDLSYPVPPPDWNGLLGDLPLESRYSIEKTSAARSEINLVSDREEEIPNPTTGNAGEDSTPPVSPEPSALEPAQSTSPLSAVAGKVVYFPGAVENAEVSEVEETTNDPIEEEPASENETVLQPEVDEDPEENPSPKGHSSEDRTRVYNLSPLSASVPGIIGQLLNPTRVSIPTPSVTLNEVLNGGWTIQRLYLITGCSGDGKTTFCSWAADFAASRHIPVIFVSFQAPKELLSIYALSRTAGIDSALIESGLCRDTKSSSAEDLRKVLMNAGRRYFRTGDYLHVLEADSETTVDDIREAVCSTRRHFGLEEGAPVVVVVDSLRELRCDIGKGGKPKPERARIAQGLLELKEMAQELNAALLVTMDIPNRQPIRHGAIEQNDFETACGLADSCFLLDSRAILTDFSPDDASLRRRNASRLQDPLDRVLDHCGQNPVLAKRLHSIRKDFPLEEKSASTYARLWTIKNRGGRTDVQPVFRYHRAYHNFEPIPLDLTDLQPE